MSKTTSPEEALTLGELVEKYGENTRVVISRLDLPDYGADYDDFVKENDLVDRVTILFPEQ